MHRETQRGEKIGGIFSSIHTVVQYRLWSIEMCILFMEVQVYVTCRCRCLQIYMYMYISLYIYMYLYIFSLSMYLYMDIYLHLYLSAYQKHRNSKDLRTNGPQKEGNQPGFSCPFWSFSLTFFLLKKRKRRTSL